MEPEITFHCHIEQLVERAIESQDFIAAIFDGGV